MNGHRHYGIELRQVYARVDGEPGRFVVRDIETYADIDDVVVEDSQGHGHRVSAFDLARARYYLVDFEDGPGRHELLRALLAGEASPIHQQRAAQLMQAQSRALGEQPLHARRGRFAVDEGEWRYLDDKRDGLRTWLCVRVAPGADLSCKGTRGSALDKAIESAKDAAP